MLAGADLFTTKLTNSLLYIASSRVISLTTELSFQPQSGTEQNHLCNQENHEVFSNKGTSRTWDILKLEDVHEAQHTCFV